jgi:hypothetical protein
MRENVTKCDHCKKEFKVGLRVKIEASKVIINGGLNGSTEIPIAPVKLECEVDQAECAKQMFSEIIEKISKN